MLHLCFLRGAFKYRLETLPCQCALLGSDSSSGAAPAPLGFLLLLFFFFFCCAKSFGEKELLWEKALRLHVPTVRAAGGEGRRGLLRTWLSSLLCPDGAGVLLLPPAHLPPLALRPVRGQRRLFPGFGPVAAAFGAAEVEQASGRCVTRAGRDRVGLG